MSSKPFVILGLCATLFLSASETAVAMQMKKPAIKIEKTRAPAELFVFIEGVLSEHPVILTAQADIDIAKVRVQRQEKSLYNPIIETEVETEAELLLQTAKANMVSAKEQIAGELVAVIVRFLSTRDMNAAAKKRVQQISRFVKKIKIRHVAGDVTEKVTADIGQSDIYTAELLLMQALIQHAEISSKLIKALGDFRGLTGAAVDPSAPFPSDLPKNISKKIDIKLLAAQHPLVLAAQLRVKALKTHIRLTTLEHPVNPGLGVTPASLDDDPFVALHYSLPILDRKQIRSNVTTTGHLVVKDEQHAKNVYRQVLGRIEAAKGQYIMMSRSWKLWSQSGQKTLSLHLTNLEKLWSSGEITTAQYLAQFQQALDIPLSGEKLKGDVWQAWVEWLVATGSVTQWLTNLK